MHYPDCHSELRADHSCPMCDERTADVHDLDDDEDGGWAINKDHSDSLWDTDDSPDSPSQPIDGTPLREPPDASDFP